LSNFKAGWYDLLLLDILMPKMNGFELYQQLKNIDDKVKVCFITAYEIYYRALRDLFPTIEVDCFIAKPIGKKELVSRIKSELKS
jgi:two-component SAPR family response regulator